MAYTDFFLLPLPKKNLTAYKKVVRLFAAVIKDCGAVSYREFVQDSVDPKALALLSKATRLKKDEVVIFSYIDYPSKAARNRAFKLMMKDERMEKMMTKVPVFDMKRIVYGGFKPIFELKKK